MPLEEWEYGYVAGLIDNHSGLVVNIGKHSDRRIGYNVTVECRIKLPASESAALVTRVCDAHDIAYRTKTRDTKYGGPEIVISRRDAVQALLRELQPYLTVRDDAAAQLADTIIPRMNDGDHQQQATFLDLMADIQTFREQVGRANRSKYDLAYFQDLWGDDDAERDQ